MSENTTNQAPSGVWSDSAAPFAALDIAREHGRPGLNRLVLLQMARTVVRLALFGSLALVVGLAVMGREPTASSWVLPPVLLMLAAALGFAADRMQAQGEAETAASLREVAGRRLAAMTARHLQRLPVGHLVISMQRHPEAISGLVIGHRAATLMMAVGPLLAAAAIFVVSWQAALLVLVLTPVMIVFFALVGETIRRRAEEQEKALGRLANQFADRMRALPTILAYRGLAREEAKLGDRLETYAARTMAVLRVAFLNAGIIDFFASLSIAMLAVFLGLGHLKLAMIPGFSNLELWQSLFILVMAPEYFAPFRRFAEQYHVKSEGMAAAAALDGLLADETFEPAPCASDSLALPPRGLVAIVGPSGSGKTTLLRKLAGIDAPETASAAIKPDVWVSTDSYVPDGTLCGAIGWRTGCTDRSAMIDVAGKVGLLDDAVLPDGLETDVGLDGTNLSGGQRLRIALARAILAKGAVIADEPTAKLDPTTAKAVRGLLASIGKHRLVVVATHDRELAMVADRTIDLPEARLESAA